MFVDTISRKLLENEQFLAEIREKGEGSCTIKLDVEPGEILATFLMSLHDIFEGINEATKNVFGNDAVASNIILYDYRSKISFRINKK